MKKLIPVLIVVALIGMPVTALAQGPTPSRMPDQMLKQQFEQVKKGLDRFIDGMDSKIKTAILKGEQGEVDIKVVLNDLKESMNKAKDRFSPGSANAVTETVAFLKNAKKFDKGLAMRPGLSGADMKWADLVPELTKLAGAYGIDFAVEPDSWVSRRTGDKELEMAVQSTRKGAEQLNKDVANLLKKDKTVDAAVKAEAGTKISGLATAAKSLEDALKSKIDSVNAVTRVLDARTAVASFMDGTAAVAAAKPAWGRTDASVEAIAKAYGVGK
ncbi:MAG: hypothetical protein NTY02_04100 [Acidobacteria bacterium]|nr:hypothetical protein [Acidobacteriota bacterium]